jgi:hypothetical protein
LQTIKVLDALKAFEKVLLEKGKAVTALKARQKELDDIMRATDNPYAAYAAAKKVYFEKRKLRLQADGEVGDLEQDYLANGGGAAAKEGIRRAKEVAAVAKGVEQDAREVMRTAKAAVDVEEKSQKKLVKDIKTARDLVETQSGLVATEQVKVGKAMDEARVAAGPEEEKRIKRVEEVSQVVTSLKTAHEGTLTVLAEIDKRLAKSTETTKTLTAQIRDLDKVLAYVKEAEISGLISELVEEVETMRLNKTLSFTDGDNLAKLSGNFRVVADDNALSDVATASVRGEHAASIADWSKAVRTADAIALRLASAGSALSRDLLR